MRFDKNQNRRIRIRDAIALCALVGGLLFAICAAALLAVFENDRWQDVIADGASNARLGQTQGVVDGEVAVPTLMYHSILNSKKGVYIVSQKQLEHDLLALKQAGYTAVFPSEVIAYAKGEGVLPLKPVMITFDDGHYNNLYYGLPVLKRCGFKAVENIVGCFSEYSSISGDHSNANYSHLTWQQIVELMDSGAFEIGNHTFDMHKFKPRYGMGKLASETEEDYRSAVRQDLEKLQTRLTECATKSMKYIAKQGVYDNKIDILSQNSENSEPRKSINVLAFPFGKYNQTVIEEAQTMGFEMLLSCTEGVSKVRFGEYDKPLLIKRVNRDGRYTTQQVIGLLERYNNR